MPDKTYTLTPRQEELLAVLLPRDIPPEEAAFQMGTTPQAAGRVMARLAALQLAFYDLTDVWAAGRYNWRLTPEGERVAKLKPDAGVTLDLDYRPEKEKP